MQFGRQKISSARQREREAEREIEIGCCMQISRPCVVIIFLWGEKGVCSCVYVCADGHLLLLICFLTLASALWFSIFCAETLSLLSRHNRLRAAANSRIYDNFRSNGLLFLSGVVHFLPRDDLHTEPQRERQTFTCIVVSLDARAANTKTSQLSRRVSVWLVFFSVARINMCCIYMRLPHFLPCSLHFSLRA